MVVSKPPEVEPTVSIRSSLGPLCRVITAVDVALALLRSLQLLSARLLVGKHLGIRGQQRP